MAEKNMTDLYCYECSLQFDGKVVYDKHQSLFHKRNVNEKEPYQKGIKTEQDKEEYDIQWWTIENHQSPVYVVH